MTKKQFEKVGDYPDIVIDCAGGGSNFAGYTPLPAMHSLGHTFVPAPIHAGGLRYHGMAPIVSQLVTEGILTPKSVTQIQAFQAGVMWARSEKIFADYPKPQHLKRK
jgi:tryptophan synthase beta chain